MMNRITAIIYTNRESDLQLLSPMVTVAIDVMSVTPGGSLEASCVVNC